MPISSQSVVQVVDAIYRDLEASSATWLEGVRDAAGVIAGRDVLALAEMHVQQASCEVGAISAPSALYVLHQKTLDFFGVETDRSERDLVARLVTTFPGAVMRHLYFSGSVSRVSTALRREGPWARAWKQLVRETTGMRDAVNAVGIDASGQGVVMSIALPEGRGPGQRPLALIAGHLASASRLRRARPTDEAVLERGRVVHAEGGARDPEARSALSRAALAIDASRRAGAGLEHAALWTALVDGQWSLVERFERDGRRFFVARRNEPPHRAERALTALEAKAAALAGLGRSQKCIAFELGIGEPRVSSLLRGALGKIGVRTRAELVELHGHLVG